MINLGHKKHFPEKPTNFKFCKIAGPTDDFWWFLKFMKYHRWCLSYIRASLEFLIKLPLPPKKNLTGKIMKFKIQREIVENFAAIISTFWNYVLQLSLSDMAVLTFNIINFFARNLNFSLKNRQKSDFSKSFSSLTHFPLNNLGSWCMGGMCVLMRPINWRIIWVGGVGGSIIFI